MMNQQQHQETRFHEIELPEACLACGGPIAARFAPGSAVGVCRVCRRIAVMEVERTADGVRVAQLPGGLA